MMQNEWTQRLGVYRLGRSLRWAKVLVLGLALTSVPLLASAQSEVPGFEEPDFDPPPPPPEQDDDPSNGSLDPDAGLPPGDPDDVPQTEEEPDPSSGTFDPDAEWIDEGGILAQCGEVLARSCEDMGGRPAVEATEYGPVCVCDVLTSSSPRIVNAHRGDVALVPMSDFDGNAGGDASVVAVIGAIGQWHRHTTIFSDDGEHVTHLTSYTDMNDALSWTPGSGFRLNPFAVEHTALQSDGTTQTHMVRQPLAVALSESDLTRSRMMRVGLVLKPRDETLRPEFERAAHWAETHPAYYRVGDYTALNGMSLPLSSGDHRRGSHCAGFVYDAFSRDFIIDTVLYDAATRDAAGHALYNVVEARVSSAITAMIGTVGEMYVAPDTAGGIANQAANCFAGFSCADQSGRWRMASTGRTVSPDNLLPASFAVGNPSNLRDQNSPLCASAAVDCSTGSFATTHLGGSYESTYTSDGRVEVENPDGVARTPFQRIEPQVFADGSVSSVRLYRW